MTRSPASVPDPERLREVESTRAALTRAASSYSAAVDRAIDAGHSLSEIARAAGVSRQAIWNAASRQAVSRAATS